MEHKEKMGELGVLNNREEGMEVVVVEEEGEEGERENGTEVVKWEKVVPRMVLRVLLVEADDSTRQIIAALLRKCNYKVAAISDGLKAWEVLKRRHNNIDLILTELDLPSISGYALLTLIMEHDSCKNIPVIIMSSQDSISMVLKCMLKGAADFLIKPVRRNELKNLWRHVWMRLAVDVHSAQNLITGQPKVEATFENHPATNQSSDNVSSSQKNSSVIEKTTDTQDLTQIKHREETGQSHKQTNHHAKNIKLEEEVAMETSGIGHKETTLASEEMCPYNEANVEAASKVIEDGLGTNGATGGGIILPENHRHIATSSVDDCKNLEPSGEAIDLIGTINKQKCTIGHPSAFRGLSSVNSTPELELSLRRFHGPESQDFDERHILNHSTASAFSWYGSNKKSCIMSSDGDLTEVKGSADHSAWSKVFNSDKNDELNLRVSQSAHGDTVPPSLQTGLSRLQGVMLDIGAWPSYGQMFQPLCSELTCPTSGSPKSAFQREESPLLTSASLYSDPGTHSSSQGCGALAETTNHSSRQAEHEPKSRESVEQCGYRNSAVVDQSDSNTPCNDLAAQHNRSGYGSVSEVTDVNATAHDMMGTSAMDGSVRNDVTSALDHDQFRSRMGLYSAEREAALAKFRQKRKGRCYEKKVRYQSRKRLAEQRPRVKGQFVRQGLTDQTLAEVDKP